MPDEDIASEDLVHDLESGIEQEVLAALDVQDAARVRDLVDGLHFSDIADLLERLDGDHRSSLVEVLRENFDAEILADLDESVREDVIGLLGFEDVAAALGDLDSDDVVEILEELSDYDQKQVLDAIPDGERQLIQESLSYPEDSAGRMMQREVVTVPTFWTVGDTIDNLRDRAEHDINPLPDHFYSVFVVDPKHKPAGAVHLDTLLRTKRPIKLTEIMEPDIKLIPVTADQEDVAFLFRQRDLAAAPVVDDAGRLVGVITIDDIVDVIDEEHEEDIMRLGGVRGDDLYDAVVDTTKARFSWLLINLLTAILASAVIGLFDATIDQMVALAVLMPIVASMGGNAGTQSLTVAVRALAMKEITATNAGRLIGKELMVGGINGFLFALLAGGVAWGWFGSLALGGVIAMAMIVNMIVAGVAGTAIPILLDKNDIDPAIASSVFITTITDIVGFFVFLGLAALLLL
ncbi:MAG: magnesium transporter [Rhodospirillales bacterium]|nr:magnesium transporter [Rhodospirillales bacterium]